MSRLLHLYDYYKKENQKLKYYILFIAMAMNTFVLLEMYYYFSTLTDQLIWISGKTIGESQAYVSYILIPAVGTVFGIIYGLS